MLCENCLLGARDDVFSFQYDFVCHMLMSDLIFTEGTLHQVEFGEKNNNQLLFCDIELYGSLSHLTLLLLFYLSWGQ